MNNLASDSAYEEIVATMRKILAEHLDVTDDPFRRFKNNLLMPEDVYPHVKGIRG